MWPGIMRDSMAVLGADEAAQARGVMALMEMTEYLACGLHDDLNRARVTDYRKVMETSPEQRWADPAVQEFFDHWTAEGGLWASDEGLPGGEDLASRMFSAAWRAIP
jgi:hypothetical protein